MTEAPEQYEKNRSHGNNHLFVICYADRFYEDVPADLIRRGPWRSSRGLVANLRPDIRLALARDGYFEIETPDAIFSPEV